MLAANCLGTRKVSTLVTFIKLLLHSFLMRVERGGSQKPSPQPESRSTRLLRRRFSAGDCLCLIPVRNFIGFFKGCTEGLMCTCYVSCSKLSSMIRNTRSKLSNFHPSR